MQAQGYPFKFSMVDYNTSHPEMLRVLQYRFKSPRTYKTYIIRAEQYRNSVYCLKFYDKATVDSANKFSLRTNTGEPRKILYTIYDIALDILTHDPLSSFFFIGAEDEKDVPGVATRRYRFCRRFTASIISNVMFDHYRVNDLSLYILLNRKQNDTTLPFVISNYVREAMADGCS